jgi:hypothetical protein
MLAYLRLMHVLLEDLAVAVARQYGIDACR